MRKRFVLPVLALVLALGIAIIWSAVAYSQAAKPAACGMGVGVPGSCPMGAAGQKAMGPGMQCGPGSCMMGLDKAVALTAEQKQKMAAVCDQCCAEKAETAAEVAKKRAELAGLLTAASPDKAKITAKIDEIAGLQARSMLDSADRFLEMRKMLTADQQKALAANAGMCAAACACADCKCPSCSGGPAACRAGGAPMVSGRACCPFTPPAAK